MFVVANAFLPAFFVVVSDRAFDFDAYSLSLSLSLSILYYRDIATEHM